MGIALNNHHPQDRSKPWETIDRGFLVDIDIGRWRAETRTTLADLELDPLHCAHVEALQGLTALGRTYLLPKRVILQLERAEQRGRALVNHYSFQVPAGMFMPVTACCRWREANSRAEAAYFEMRDRICGLMPQLRREVLDGYVRLARQSFDLLRERGVSVGRTRPAFVNHYVNRIAAQIPAVEIVRQSFHWETSLSYISLGVGGGP